MKNKVYVGLVLCCALLFLFIGGLLLCRDSENSIAGTACVGWTCEEHREFDNILVSGVTMETAWEQCTDLLMLLRDDGCNNSDKYIKIKSQFLEQSGLLNEGDTVYLSLEEYSWNGRLHLCCNSREQRGSAYAESKNCELQHKQNKLRICFTNKKKAMCRNVS